MNRRIALLRLSALGDVLRVLPAWANLHEAFPDVHFQAVIEDRHAFLLEPFPWLEPVILHRRAISGPLGFLSETRRVAKCIREAEASLDFHGILKSAWIPMRAKIAERWGDGVTKEGAGWMQTHPQPFRYQSRYQQALGLAEAFGKHHGISGLGHFHPVLKHLELPEAGEIWSQSVKPRVVLVPGASRRGAIKRWPMHHWLKLASMLKDRCELRWSLGPEEEALREWLPQQTGVPDLPKLPLWRLASALRQADLVIAPDTGLLHLSVVLGVKVLGLYGGSDPVIADIPKGTGEILRTGIECSPCRERKCQRRQCLEELSPEFVASRVSAL